MDRILEPELMDDGAQAQAYADADFEAPHAALIAAIFARFPAFPPTGVALDLGCGPADITRRFAEALPGWAVHGLDGSEAMLARGAHVIATRGLLGRVTLVRGRLPEEGPPLPCYDAVISNSLLHHLPDPAVLWDAVRRYAAAGAPVCILDLMRPESPEAVQAMVERYTVGEPDILKRDFSASLFAAFTLDEVRAQVAAAGLDLTVEALSDRHLVAWGWAP